MNICSIKTSKNFSSDLEISPMGAASTAIEWMQRHQPDPVTYERCLEETLSLFSDRPLERMFFLVERIQSRCHHLIFSEEKNRILDAIFARKIQTLKQYVHLPEGTRRYPPLSTYDTFVARRISKISSVHGQATVFFDSEIISIHPVVHSIPLKAHSIGPSPCVDFTDHGKAIIQQQAVRGCTAATAAMLIRDHGGPVDLFKLESTNIGTTEKMCRMIEQARLTPTISQLSANLDELASAISNNGPAIITLLDYSGGHSIIVDAIDEETARIRDPYHGWEITIRKDALARRYQGGDVIQIRARSLHSRRHNRDHIERTLFSLQEKASAQDSSASDKALEEKAFHKK